MKKRILYQNEACMIINKLPGESSEFPEVEREGEDGKFPVPVHRLDVPVSGCLLLARFKEAATYLGAMFSCEDTYIQKHYWAIVESSPEADSLPAEGELVHWLYENERTNKSLVLPLDAEPPSRRRIRERPKKAILRYRLVGKGDHYLFLDINLVTGRHHQIRAQLAAVGLHIKGDLKYGAKRSEKDGGIRLHAYSLVFPNPLLTNRKIKVKALPPVMDPLWKAFKAAIEIN